MMMLSFLLLASSLVLSLVLMLFSWRKNNTRLKIISGFQVVFFLFMIIVMNTLNWGIFPWGRTTAFQTADKFLAVMKQGDYSGAIEYMRPCIQESARGDLGETTKPISWQWTNYEYHPSFVSTIGAIKFVDGTELRLELRMKWNGFKWEIFGIIFGEPYKNPRIQLMCFN
jgi:hypothetical protein